MEWKNSQLSSSGIIQSKIIYAETKIFSFKKFIFVQTIL